MGELDGRPVTAEELAVLALVNYGHFTTFRVEGRRVRGLGLHLRRLRDDCQALFGVDLNSERVRELVRRVVPSTGSATVRVTVFDPSIDLVRPHQARSPRVLVTLRQSAAAVSSPLQVRSVHYVRDAHEVKSVGLFGSLLQRRLAQQAGFDDALFLDEAGGVLEGGTWNVGFFDGERVIWPTGRSLAGVTMRLLQSSRPYQAVPVSIAELSGMQAAFATDAATGVRMITAIDDWRFPGQHPVIDDLGSEYLAQPGDLL
jgi:branched-subunit amino acid aminotransferase/4-amino-4-deoxychorismate lyase